MKLWALAALLALLAVSAATAAPKVRSAPCQRGRPDPLGSGFFLLESSCRTDVILVGSISVSTRISNHYEYLDSHQSETQSKRWDCSYTVRWTTAGQESVKFFDKVDYDDVQTTSYPNGKTTSSHHTTHERSVDGSGKAGTWSKTWHGYLVYGPVKKPFKTALPYTPVDFAAPIYTENTIVATDSNGNTTTTGPDVYNGRKGDCDGIVWSSQKKILNVLPSGVRGSWIHNPGPVLNQGDNWHSSALVYWSVFYNLRAVRRGSK